ncbi:TPA: hypothetical protein ACH9JA_005308, partial [Escherichia coli]
LFCNTPVQAECIFMAYPFRRKCDIPHMTETTQRKTGADSRIQDKLTLHNPALLRYNIHGQLPL